MESSLCETKKPQFKDTEPEKQIWTDCVGVYKKNKTLNKTKEKIIPPYVLFPSLGQHSCNYNDENNEILYNIQLDLSAASILFFVRFG